MKLSIFLMRTVCIYFLLFTAVSVNAVTYYVSLDGGNVPPYTNWAMAATVIQDAVDTATNGDEVIVADGVYDQGGVKIPSRTLSNRVYVTKPIVLRSVNGPANTVIAGNGPVGRSAVRCVYLDNSAEIHGFTLTNGHCYEGDFMLERKGGGVFAYHGGIISNCIVTCCESAENGGGIACYTTGIVADCTVTCNTSTDSGGGIYARYYSRVMRCSIDDNIAGNGGGLYLDGNCIAENCRIRRNSGLNGYVEGGGVYLLSNDEIVNSYIADNDAGTDYGGGMHVQNWNCTVMNCTVTRNRAGRAGGIYAYNGALVVNSIVYGNEAYSGNNFGHNYLTGTYIHCCITPDPGGKAIVTDDPLLAGVENPHLTAASPCINAGTNALSSGVDIDGEARIYDGVVDIGCDEYHTDAITGAIDVAIVDYYPTSIVGFTFSFTAETAGRITHFNWDFGAGSTGTDTTTVTHAWEAAGSYDVILTAYNDENPGGVSATATVTVLDEFTTYASLTGAHTPPFTSWATASTNIQDAVDACVVGGDVIVGDGSFGLGGRTNAGYPTHVVLDKPVHVSSLNGPDATYIVEGNVYGWRGVSIDNGAVLEGITISNCHADGSSFFGKIGGGVFMFDGLISNCVVMHSVAKTGGGIVCYGGGTVADTIVDGNICGSGSGGGVYCIGDTAVQRCHIRNNRASSMGGGVYNMEGTVCSSFIHDNTAQNMGGGIYNYGGTVCNCLIHDNTAGSSGGGGAYLVYGTIESCTITRNTSPNGAGVRVILDNHLRNSIIWENNGDNYQNTLTNMLYEYCCTTPDPGTFGVMTVTNDPLFVAPTAGVFRLLADSPCVDAGTNAYVCTSIDLCRGMRVRGGIVDIGAYEYTSSPELRVDTPVRNFGEINVAESSHMAASVCNIGAGILTCEVTGVTAPFSVTQTTYYITACTSGGIDFFFQPDTQGTWSNTVVLTGGSGGSILLVGTGVPEPCAIGIFAVFALVIVARQRSAVVE